MNILKKFVLICALLTAGAAQAGDSSSGCGLGWMVFKKNSLISSALRATTNAIFLNSIAMTFGTSGCAQHSIVKNEKKSLHYAENNLPQLMVDMASGEGEFINGFAQTLGCDGAEFSKAAQANYGKIITKQEMKAPEFLNNVHGAILSDETLARSCGLI